MFSPDSKQSIKSVLALLTYRFRDLSGSAGLDAQVLLANAIDRPRTWVLAHPEWELTEAQVRTLQEAAHRFEQGEPLPYVLGRWEFFGLEFEVSPAALIPRPETELLVEQALAWLRSQDGPRWAADVGAGTGCVTAALAANHPGLHVVAIDISWPALRLARRNLHRHGLDERTALVLADLLPPICRRFDLICANLPYIPTAMLAGLPVRNWEPQLALDGGADGLDLIRRLMLQAPQALAPGGLAVIEIEATQGAVAKRLAQQAFPGAQVTIVRDLAGRDRLVRIQKHQDDLHHGSSDDRR